MPKTVKQVDRHDILDKNSLNNEKKQKWLNIVGYFLQGHYLIVSTKKKKVKLNTFFKLAKILIKTN